MLPTRSKLGLDSHISRSKMFEGRRHSVDIPVSRALVAIMRSRSLRDPDTNSLAKFPAKKTIWEDCSCDAENWEGNNYGRHSFSYNLYDHFQRRREEFGDGGKSGRFVNSPINIIKANARAKAALHNHSCCGTIPGMSRAAAKDRGLHLDVEGRELARGGAGTFQENSRSLLQKCRPRSFSDLVGQNVVAQSLTSALSKGKLAPLYLFHGPHGTGKTSAARIFAAALNCLSVKENQPCGVCDECTMIFSGKSSSVVEIDASKLDCKSRVAALLRSACVVPVSSHFKILIIDDCRDLDKEGWYSIYSSLEEIPNSSIFVMITSDIDKLPTNCISWCQNYRFSKIEDADIAHRLTRICMKEGMEYEVDALDLLARKANGSLRDAVLMLDQLTLLGKRITRSVTHELIGDVSDNDLLDLLNLAMTSDAASIVRRARELLSSKVDPLQLLAQLANLIMDLLAGKNQSGSSEIRKVIAAEVDAHKLRNALEILTETEKQLKTTKNQTTWLTAALLQFNMREPFYPEDTAASSMFTENETDDGNASAIMKENFELASRLCCQDRINCLDMNLGDPDVLDTIWTKALENCTSKSLQNLLLKDGKLTSLYTSQGLAIAELQFCHPEDISTSQSFWKPLVVSLQDLLGCNVEIRINLVAPSPNNAARGKSSSVSLVMHSRTDPETLHSSPPDCRTASSSRRECPSPLRGQRNDKPLNLFVGDVPASNNTEGGRILSYQKISAGSAKDAILDGSIAGTACSKEGQLSTVDEGDVRPGCLAKILMFASCTLFGKTRFQGKPKGSSHKKGLLGCYLCKRRPCLFYCKTKAEETYRSEAEKVF